MMPQVRSASLLACLAALSLGAPAGADPDITVKGQRIEPELAHAQALDYVRKVGIATGLTPAARWIDPVCVEVLGLDRPVADLVSKRVRAVAQRIGARVGGTACRTNAVIAFSADGANYVRKLEQRDPHQLEEADGARLDNLRHGPAPLRWWYRTGIRGADDDAEAMTPPQGFQISSEGGPSTDGGPRQNVMKVNSPSIIATPDKRAIISAAVVVDVNRASGAALSAVGDYAALVLLAEIAPPAEPPPGSILALFAPGEAHPDALTAQDEALLRTLYALPLARDARFHRGKLVGGLTNAALGGAQ